MTVTPLVARRAALIVVVLDLAARGGPARA
jgi:hypothetical protein